MNYKIGIVGHVDNGKTTLTSALTGVWADRHSEETKRGITIKLGYVVVRIYHCDRCDRFLVKQVCPGCSEPASMLEEGTIVDVPGHKNLILVFLSGITMIDLGLIIVDAKETQLSSQTKEHIRGLDLLGTRRCLIVHNKIETATKEQMLESYEQIRRFCKGTVADGAPIIPISALHQTNIDLLVRAIHEAYQADHTSYEQQNRERAARPSLFAVSRSFDINCPGPITHPLHGGILGGVMIDGTLTIGDTIELRNGAKDPNETELRTTVLGIMEGNHQVPTAQAGGVYTIETGLDPGMTTGDALAGSLVGHLGTVPPLRSKLLIRLSQIESNNQSRFTPGQSIIVQYLTCTSYGTIQAVTGKELKVELQIPLAVQPNTQLCVIIDKLMYGGIVSDDRSR